MLADVEVVYSDSWNQRVNLNESQTVVLEKEINLKKQNYLFKDSKQWLKS